MKLLIVDDEPLIQKKLENLIRSSALGIHTLLSATDSTKALQLLQEEQPQILLTDIRMPRITGVDLARYIYENHLDTLVLFITGYSDFEYAKSAIDYQVFDYLLKPLDGDKALESIKKAVNKVLEQQKHKEMYSLFQNYFSSHFESARKQFIEKLLFHPLTQTKEQLSSAQKQFHMGASHYCLCAVTFSCENNSGNEEFYYTYMIEQFFNRRFPDFLTYSFGSTIYLVWLIQDSLPDSSEIFQLFKEIKEEVEQNYPISVFSGISDFTDDLSQMTLLRKQITQCLEYAHMQPDASVIFYSDLSDTFSYDGYFDMIDSITSLIRQLRLGEKEAILKEFHHILEQFQNRSDSYISDTIELMISNILLFIHDLAIPSTEVEKIENTILTPIHQQTKTDLKIEYFQYWLEFIADCMKNTQSAEQNQLIQSIYDYINMHYSESIGLTTLSEYVGRNPSYLSRLIKQQTNKNFSQILTERRMDEAKNLLRNTTMKIPQIAEKTGYPNVRYFTRVFNSHMSMSPADYRKITTAFCSS